MTKVAERGGGVRTFLEKFPRLQNENMLVLTNLNLMKGWSNIVCGFFIITSIWTENEHSYVFFLTISGGRNSLFTVKKIPKLVQFLYFGYHVIYI